MLGYVSWMLFQIGVYVQVQPSRLLRQINALTTARKRHHHKAVSEYVLFFAAAPSGIPIHLRSKQKTSLKREHGEQAQALPGGPVLKGISCFSFQNPR